MPRNSIAGALSVCVLLAASLVHGDDRPNIILAIADDWSYPHAGAYGDRVVQTPNFDRLAREGILFHNTYAAAPSCTASRGAILSGQAIHRLGAAANLWSALPADFVAYTDLLAEAGYQVGSTGKGWGPGSLEISGREFNPAGRSYRGFRAFLDSVPEGTPFCYWFGSTDPHRPYESGSGNASGLDAGAVEVPPFLPDDPVIREDLLDYYVEVQRFDRQVGEILETLDQAGLASNTIVIMTSDNGMPFPRAKATLYDAGTRMPLVIRWPSKIAGGRTTGAFTSLTDLAPTFLEAARLDIPKALTGESLIPLLTGSHRDDASRDAVVTERERHANVRRGDLSYPSRALRTERYLYIQNLRPDRWPAGDPQAYFSVGPFGDIDGSPSKSYLLEHRADPELRALFELACGKRPAEELYDVNQDPHQLVNLVEDPDHQPALLQLRERLNDWRATTEDPRLDATREPFDRLPYFGGPARPARP